MYAFFQAYWFSPTHFPIIGKDEENNTVNGLKFGVWHCFTIPKE
jgi:hypothetical protein